MRPRDRQDRPDSQQQSGPQRRADTPSNGPSALEDGSPPCELAGTGSHRPPPLESAPSFEEAVPPPALPLTSLAVLMYGGMLALAVGLAYWRGHLTQWFNAETWLEDLALGVLIAGVIVVISRGGMRIEAIRSLSMEFSRLLKGLSWPQVFVLALTSGVAEEALFRGAIQPELGLVLASAIFAGLHIGPTRRYLWWTAFAFVVGLLFGVLYDWRGSLTTPIMAHMLVNLLNIRHLSRLEVPPSPRCINQALDRSD